MRYHVTVMPSAEEDIVSIIGYISDDLGNRMAASEHYNAFNEALGSLEQMPDRNPVSGLDVLRQRHIRLLPVRNYVVLYRVFTKERKVEVYRVLYSGMDIERRILE